MGKKAVDKDANKDTEKTRPKNIKQYELSGGPFCGVAFACIVAPDSQLLLSGTFLHGYIEKALETAYLKKRVKYVLLKIANGSAVYRYDDVYLEIGQIGNAG